MKNSKLRRALLLLASAVLLVSLSVGATLAYLTSTTDTVVNTFTVGKVGITLDEADVDEYGNQLYVENEAGETVKADRVITNTYKLLPGHTYIKDPTIHIDDDSEESYLRVKISFTNAAASDALFSFDQNDPAAATIFTGFDASKWTVVENTLADGVRTYVLNYNTTINGDTADIVLFTHVVVPGDLTNAEIDTLAGTNMNIVAYAIQKDGFDTAADAWEAFEE